MNLNDIVAAAKQFDNIASGNCGTFAVALHRWLLQHGKESSIVVITDSGVEESDLFGGDVDIYHVYVGFENKWIDGLGIFTQDEAVKVLETQVATALQGRDGDVFEFAANEITASFVLNVIHANTNYTIHEDAFLNWMSS